MKYAYLPTVASTMVLAISTLSASHALAADPEKPKTRAEVLQELNDAKRTGEIQANDESGLKLNEEYPQRYQAKAKGPGLTREQVRQELMEAERMGEIPANDDSGLQMHEEFPSRYPAQETGPRLAREQVRRDLEEARRTGKIPRTPVEGD